MFARFFLLVLLVSTLNSTALDWPHFRGPDHNGVSRETGWAMSNEPKIAWRAKVGLGFSTFVVTDGKVITTGHDGKKVPGNASVWCLDAATGAVVWKHAYPAPLGDLYFDGGTTGTPTVHAGKVFQFTRQGRVFCLDLNTGQLVWEANPVRELEANMPDWGYASSPFLAGNLVILNLGGAGTALDAATGRIAWKSTYNMAAYATPVPFELEGKRCVALLSHKECLALEAVTGKVLWRQKFVSGYNTSAAAPVIHDGTLLLAAYDVPAVKLNLRDGSPLKEWKTDTRVNFNAGVVLGGHYYVFHGEAGKKGGELRCLDWKTGATKWAQTGLGVGSLIAADGKLICLGETGELAVVEATPEKFKAIARAQVLGGKCWAAPVLANGRLYARNAKGDVVCVAVERQN